MCCLKAVQNLIKDLNLIVVFDYISKIANTQLFYVTNNRPNVYDYRSTEVKVVGKR